MWSILDLCFKYASPGIQWNTGLKLFSLMSVPLYFVLFSCTELGHSTVNLMYVSGCKNCALICCHREHHFPTPYVEKCPSLWKLALEWQVLLLKLVELSCLQFIFCIQNFYLTLTTMCSSTIFFAGYYLPWESKRFLKQSFVPTYTFSSHRNFTFVQHKRSFFVYLVHRFSLIILF